MIYKKSSLGLLIICVILGCFYISPKFQKFKENNINKKIVNNCNMVADYILKEYELNKKIDLKTKVDESIELFSGQVQNPVNSKQPAFTSQITEGACAVQYEESTKTVVVTGLALDESILVRIVLNPPTFIRYDRD